MDAPGGMSPMLATADRALARASMALVWSGCAIVAALFLLIIVDVTLRTLGFRPFAFNLAVVEYGLLYFAMCSAPYLVRTRGHVVIEAIVAQLPNLVRLFLAKLVYLVCFGLCAIMTWYSVELLSGAIVRGAVDVRGINMPFWLLYLPLPVGFGLTGLEFLRYLFGLASYYTYDLGEIKDNM